MLKNQEVKVYEGWKVIGMLSDEFMKQNKKSLETSRLLKVDATGFEPATSASRTQRSTKLSHASLSEMTVYNNTIKSDACQLENEFFLCSNQKNLKREVRKEILALAEPSYQKFSSKLLPGTENIAGVRLPLLRKKAKQIVKRGEWREYLEQSLSQDGWKRSAEKNQADKNKGEELFEEMMLQGFLIGYIPVTLKERFEYLDQFIPKIDNWSVCDSVCATMKFALDHRETTWEYLQKYIKSQKEYEIRFAVVMYINYYITEEYLDKVFDEIENIRSSAYYVKMAVAWAVSMCYVLNTKKTENFLKTCSLDDFTYNKAIQKMIESKQTDAADKEKLKMWKRKQQQETEKSEHRSTEDRSQ